MPLFGRRLKPKPIKDVPRVIYDLRKCESFRGVPEDNIRDVVEHMVKLEGKAGAIVVKQGDKGEYYYVVLQGLAEVVRAGPKRKQEEVLAELGEGAGFGEEALISNEPRNATVRLKTDGVVARLPKEQFLSYIERSLVDWLPLEDARAMIKHGGAQWIDVREASKGVFGRFPDSHVLPLATLRDQLGTLPKETPYVCYCDDGRLSATAAFLMRQRGYKAAALKGGVAKLTRGE